MKKLLPAIIQDCKTGQVLMLGYMNQAAYQKTIATQLVTFWSRSRKCLWTKGETSGNRLLLKKIVFDCDQDALLCLVQPTGPACHTGTNSCFSTILEQLAATLKTRLKTMPKNSYSSSLFKEGLKAINAKVIEEAQEVTKAANQETTQRLIEEIADLWFHLLVLMTYQGATLQDITNELAARKK